MTTYEIQVRTRKRPVWELLYLVPASGDSAPARFQGKEDAKRCIRGLQEREEATKQYRTPFTRREFRLQRVEGASIEPPAFIPTAIATSYL